MSRIVPKNRLGCLYSEIARLKQIISENEDTHAKTISSWTKECGRMGNEIGRLKKNILETENKSKNCEEYNLKLSQENISLKTVVEQMDLQITELKALIDTYETSDNLGTSKSNQENNAVQIERSEKQESKINQKMKGSMEALDLNTGQEARENEITVKPKSFWNLMTALKKQVTKGNKPIKSSRSPNYEEMHKVDSFGETIKSIKAEISELKIKLNEKDDAIDFYKGVCDAKVAEIQQLQMQ